MSLTFKEALDAFTGQLTHYTLTSANDAPYRDPQCWKVEGCERASGRWKLLDKREAVLFPSRKLERIFPVRAPCVLPRIVRVRPQRLALNVLSPCDAAPSPPCGHVFRCAAHRQRVFEVGH